MSIIDSKIANLLNKRHRRSIRVLDVGARDGLQWPWCDVPPVLVDPVLVEPDPVEALLLQEKLEGSGVGKVLPVALWHEDGKINVNLNKSPGTSSVFKPNSELLHYFPEMHRFDLTSVLEVDARAVDSLSEQGEIPDIDFAKLDIQGAELAVLRGGRQFFAENLVGLEAEVEFAELYSGQPLFHDLDLFVQRELGLQFWDIRGTYWRYKTGEDRGGPLKGRMIFGDVLYLRGLPGLIPWIERMPKEVAIHKVVALIISSVAYGYPDYGYAVLKEEAIRDLMPREILLLTNKVLATATSGTRPFKDGNGYLYLIFGTISRMFKPIHNGWASGQENLGSRRRGPSWW